MSLAHTGTIPAPRPIFKRQARRWPCVARRVIVLSLLLIAAA